MKFKNKKTGIIEEWDCETIDSRLLTAQSRGRCYWTNIPIKPIIPTNITVKDILDEIPPNIGHLDPYFVSDNEVNRQLKDLLSTSKYMNTFTWNRDSEDRILVKRPDGLKIQRIGRIAFGKNKTEILTCLTQPYIFDGSNIRKVSETEAERLQGVPENYTNLVAKSARYKLLGNGCENIL